MNKQSLRKMVEEAIEEYNKYRSPEATAKLVSMNGKILRIEFLGPYCRTCGFYDYFEDFVYVLEDFGTKSQIDEVEETDNGAIVTFVIVD
jgi:superoxide reductase